jgi:ADP-ribose pyrophosphatase YjhB (NUDIX family)
VILLVSKKRSKKWGIPKGRVNAALSFGETAAKKAFEEAGVIGRVSPNSIGMFRAKKGTPIPKNIKVWVYLLEVDKTLSNWPEKKPVRLDGYHVKSLLGSSVNRCSPIFVTALRRARATVAEVAPQRRRSAAGMTAIGFREESRCSPGIDRPRRGAGHRRHARTGDRYGEAGLSSQRSEMSLPAERPNPI